MTKYSSSLRTPNQLDVAYTAGLFDGVGTFDSGRFRINISNTDKHVIDWLAQTWGGGNASKLSSRDFYFWALTSLMDVKFFLETLAPWLLKKKKRATQMLVEIDEKIGGQ